MPFNLPGKETLETISKTNGGTLLLPHHAALLTQSAISPDVAAERRYMSISRIQALGMGFRGNQVGESGGLLIPRYLVDGRQNGFQLRPDEPRLDAKGKPVKYESPRRQPNRFDVHPRCVKRLKDRRVDLWWTEGARKVDYLVSLGFCVIGLTGVFGWRYKDPVTGSKVPVPCFEEIALNDRRILLAFDSDVMIKKEVKEAFHRLRRFVSGKGAEVIELNWRKVLQLAKGKLHVN